MARTLVTPSRMATTAAATLATLATAAAAAAALAVAQVASTPPLLLPDPLRPPPCTRRLATFCKLLAHLLCRVRVLLWQMVKRGELLEPTSAAHLAKLMPLKHSGACPPAHHRSLDPRLRRLYVCYVDRPDQDPLLAVEWVVVARLVEDAARGR